MGYLLSVKPGDPWSPGLLVAYVVFHLPLQCQRMIYERRWIPAFAGMTVVVEATAKFLPSSPACDDCCVGGSHAIRIPRSLPAQAGIQCRCMRINTFFH